MQKVIFDKATWKITMEIGIYDQEIIYAICTDPATNGNIVSCPLGSLKPIGQFLPKCIPM